MTPKNHTSPIGEELKPCPFCGASAQQHDFYPLGKPIPNYGCGACNVWMVDRDRWQARAELTAPAQPAVSGGWKALPPELTHEMRGAMARAAREYMQQNDGGNSPDVIYEAAFAAAPAQPCGDADQADADQAVDPTARYIVIGYGESDYPQAAFANDRDELLDAVLGMIYTKPSDACDDAREEYRRDLADEDEWCAKVWRIEFEIGGIEVYDLGYGTALPRDAEQADEAVNLEGLREKLLKPRAIVRDADGWLSHPHYPICDEGTCADKFLEAFGVETAFVYMESDNPEFAERWHEEGLTDCSVWSPTAPNGDGWQLLQISDTEDGPYAMFGRDLYEAEQACKRENTKRLAEVYAARAKGSK